MSRGLNYYAAIKTCWSPFHSGKSPLFCFPRTPRTPGNVPLLLMFPSSVRTKGSCPPWAADLAYMGGVAPDMSASVVDDCTPLLADFLS
uniref:Uncharacterized protein n=1 Tax=Physcomitrium patens TaxID=3218 RepID=A0A2K1JLY4_PHYPA|nr:hypothetical protein PHYPA_017387 [Physcomitrium patens]